MSLRLSGGPLYSGYAGSGVGLGVGVATGVWVGWGMGVAVGGSGVGITAVSVISLVGKTVTWAKADCGVGRACAELVEVAVSRASGTLRQDANKIMNTVNKSNLRIELHSKRSRNDSQKH